MFGLDLFVWNICTAQWPEELEVGLKKAMKIHSHLCSERNKEGSTRCEGKTGEWRLQNPGYMEGTERNLAPAGCWWCKKAHKLRIGSWDEMPQSTAEVNDKIHSLKKEMSAIIWNIPNQKKKKKWTLHLLDNAAWREGERDNRRVALALCVKTMNRDLAKDRIQMLQGRSK